MDKISKLLVVYDDLQFSKLECRDKIVSLFKFIESNNSNDKSAKHLNLTEDSDQITLTNKYYTCKILFGFQPITKIKTIKIEENEAIILYFSYSSIQNKSFQILDDIIKEDHNLAAAIVLFDETREKIEEHEDYNKFVGDSLDKHFEIIADCGNKKDFNEDDGAGALNLSLHSAMWSHKEEVKKKNDDAKKIDDIKKEESKKEENKKKGYDLLNDQEEIDKVFNKIKEIKLINSNPGISDEQRRENAEKAALMLAEMFGLDEDSDEENKEKRNND